MPIPPSRRDTGIICRQWILHATIVAAAFVLTSPIFAAPPAKAPTGSQRNSVSVAETLRARIKALLGEGRVDDAVRLSQAALRESPDDTAIRAEFVDLHLSLARNWLAEERFTDTETALDAILRVQPGQRDAALLKQSIAAARRAIPARLRQARAWIELEWFEPAFAAYRQAVALSPAHREAWIADYRAAAVGAGDDEYLTKNFHQAFYYYDAALTLGEEAGIESTSSLVSRWLQSLAHALMEDQRVHYPPAYWKLVFERIARSDYEGPDAEALKATLEAIAFEHAGDSERAAGSYARAARTTSGRASPRLAAARLAALRVIRGLYDPKATGRRAGEWRRSDTSAPQLLESDRFRVHHRNALIAQRVAQALDFHFARIADTWSLDVEEIPWNQKADIHLHPDVHAFREATGQLPPVTAISHIRLQGSEIRQKIIHVHLGDELLMSASLAHELAHLMMAELRRDRPLPAVIAEGLALHAEPDCRHRQFARLFQGLKRKTPIRRLLQFEDVHPTDASFYSEAHRLMAVLRTRTNFADILELRSSASDAQHLARKCGFSDRRQLQRIYNDSGRGPTSR